MTSNKGDGKAIRWILAHLNHVGDECLTWPFALTNGYGQFGFLGDLHYAHRFMCELVHGPAPSDEHEAAHSCGRGQFGCVNRNHLLWKTPGENQLDRALHDTKNTWSWRGKLTQKQADEIRALKGLLTQREIATLYGVSRSNVSFIHCDKAWTGKPHKYTKFQQCA